MGMLEHSNVCPNIQMSNLRTAGRQLFSRKVRLSHF